MQFMLTHKDLLEVRYWVQPGNMTEEKAKQPLYLKAMQIPHDAVQSVLEIGTGPHWGLLPHIRANRKTGVDPLYPAYHALGLLEDRDGTIQIDEAFERWDTNDQFDTIVSVNAIDHGEMGFYLLPKIWRMLKVGGRLYMHSHLRKPDEVNLSHDHALTLADLDRHLSYTRLVEERREILPADVDGFPLQSLLGAWRKDG